MKFSQSIVPFVIGLALGVADGIAQAPRSPFLRPTKSQAVVVNAPVEDAELQFCGMFGDGDAKRFNVYNKSTNRSAWLRLGEEGPDEIFVDHYNREESAIMVRQGGRSLNLALQAATITAGGRAQAPVQLMGNSNDLIKTVKTNPTSADESRRLEAVAAEVRRRRALRQTAGAGQTVPPSPVP